MMTHTRVIILAMLLVVLATAAIAADKPVIAWLSYEDGLAVAAESGKMVMIDFHADWCKYCKKMDKETFTDPGVIRLIEQYFVPISVDTQKQKKIGQQYSVKSLPTIWFLESDGSPITPLPGFADAKRFRTVLGFMSSRSFESMSFDDYIKGN
jgi:thioredoxin-related protein